MLSFLASLFSRKEASNNEPENIIDMESTDPDIDALLVTIRPPKDQVQDQDQVHQVYPMKLHEIVNDEIKMQGIKMPFTCAVGRNGVEYKYDGKVIVNSKGESIKDTLLIHHVDRAYDGKALCRVVADYYQRHFKKCRSARLRHHKILPLPKALNVREIFY